MPYPISKQHRDELARDGVTILRGILPSSLVADLRRAVAPADEVARRARGDAAQRLQPISVLPEFDQRPIRDYAELPELWQAVQELLSTRHRPSTPRLGLLVRPTVAHSTTWHRDVYSSMDAEEFWRDAADPDLFWQCNCALYADRALWIVPGSHARRNLPEEVAHAALHAALPRGSWEAHHGYAAGMPGASQVALEPGDYALYRACLWHCGAYAPTVPRATLHDHVDTDASVAWRASRVAAAGAA